MMLVNTLSFEATMEDRMFEHENCSGMINLNNEEASEKEPSTLDELENFVEVKVRQLSRTLIKQWLETCEDTQLDPATKCRWCGADANYVSKRVATVSTKFGLVRYRRAYYICPQCHQSTCPLDERLNPYESLARLRAQIANGNNLPVNEFAEAWGLGSLNQSTGNSFSIKISSQDDLPLSSHPSERYNRSHTYIYDFPSVSTSR
jgi:hypothetical protein